MTGIALTNLIDAVRVNAPNIPRNAPKVAGYVTGTGVVPWTAAEWDLFPHSGHVRIDQSPDLSEFAAGRADVGDVEPGAGTPHAFAAAAEARVARGITWSTVYADDTNLAAVQQALDASTPHGWYFGHVDCWVADWNLSATQAAALIGHQVHGMTCRAVQWASPTTNPHTLLPGSALTLSQAQVDLSIAEKAWHPAPLDVIGEVKALAAQVSTDVGRLFAAVGRL